MLIFIFCIIFASIIILYFIKNSLSYVASHLFVNLTTLYTFLLRTRDKVIIVIMSKYKYEREFMFSTHRLEEIEFFLES